MQTKYVYTFLREIPTKNSRSFDQIKLSAKKKSILQNQPYSKIN